MKKIKLALFIGLFCLLSGCQSNGGAEETGDVLKEETTSFELDKADSLDRAVVLKIDEKNTKVSFKNLSTGRNYTLNYDGTTSIKNRFEEEIVPGQLKAGTVVHVTFLKGKKLARKILTDSTCTNTEAADNFTINSASKTMVIAEKQYELADNLAVISNTREIDLMEIDSCDVLGINAEDRTVYSIVVEKGHGYIRLLNDEYFIGGFVEVGQSIIKPITESMLLVVPEGTYTLQVSNDGYGGEKEIVVERDKELQVDLSGLKGTQDKKLGKIVFTISPTNAQLFIDGKEIDYSEPVELEYGVHRMVLKAEGYSTLSQYIKVGQASANIDVTMQQGESTTVDDTDKTTDTSVSSNTVTTGNSTDNSNPLSEYSIYIDAPDGAELYLDGSYVGIVPVKFTKVSGSHTITLRKNGYQTKSYTLQIDSTSKDVTYSFSELVASTTDADTDTNKTQ